MKHQEKVHLRGDPFVHFVGKSIVFFQKHKREVLWGLGAVVLIVLALVLVIYFRGSLAARENDLLTKALDIKSAPGLSVDEKIVQMKNIRPKKGISSVVALYVAQLYIEKGDYQNARTTLNGAPSSRLSFVNDQKKLLEAEILQAEGKSKEAQDILTIMLSDSRTEMAKDFILLQLARLQVKSGHKPEAVSTLERVMAEFPNSMFAVEARNLLGSLDEG